MDIKDNPSLTNQYSDVDLLQSFDNRIYNAWSRILRDAPNVLDFGAVGDDDHDDTAAFFDAQSYAESNGHPFISVPATPANVYTITDELVLNQTRLIGETMQTILYWPTDLGSGTYPITFLDSSGTNQKRPGIENLQIYGPATTLTLGTAPCNMDGVRIGQDGDGAKAVLRNVCVQRFRDGIVFDNNVGHISVYDSLVTNCYNGVYVRRGNGDYLLMNVDLIGNLFSGIAMPRNTGINVATFIRGHNGFQPYGFYQSNVDDAGTGNRTSGTFLSGCTLMGVNFEAIGNNVMLSEASTANYLYSNTFLRCGQSFNNTYKIAARAQDWAISVPYAEDNSFTSADRSWEAGTAGFINAPNGTGRWLIEGELPSITGGQVLISGDTRFNRIKTQAYRDLQVTVLSGATSATYTFTKYELAMLDAIRPTVTPLVDPGSRYWVTMTSTTLTINLQSAAPTNVTFNVHLTS